MKRWIIVLAALSLLLLTMLPACGGGKEETPVPTSIPTATPSPTPTAIATSTATPTPTSAMEPVKIGAIAPWSGPMAMTGMLTDQIISVVEEQVRNMGGILGGREVKIVRADDRGVVAESVAQAKKLTLEDKVTILTLGGISAAHFSAVAEAAEELKVPYIAFASIYGLEGKKYSACLYSTVNSIERFANFITNVVKPKTVAWLAIDNDMSRVMIDGLEDVQGARERLRANGIDIVYEQYFPPDTMDLSPYLTKIKYLNPDLVTPFINTTEQAITLNKQVMELGGWGSIKVFFPAETNSGKTLATMPAELGAYASVIWVPGSDDPGMKAFEDAYTQKYNRLPDPALTYFYNDFWAAIKAVELAGTDDRDKVAQAMRSGNLEWDSAWGHLRIPPNGKGQIDLGVAQIQEGGKLVKVWPQ